MKSTKTVKTFALLMCALMVLTAFTALVAARAERCESCGGQVVLSSDTTREFVSSRVVICSVNPIYSDVLTDYRVTKYWACRSCGEVAYTRTSTETVRSCGHDRDSGYDK